MQRAFTLIELSIVLAIIAVIAGTALMSGQDRMGFAQTRQTSKKLDKIEEALAAYLKLNGDLPCPADGSLAEDDAAFGDADCVTGRIDIADPDILIGSVPVNALNLSDEFAFDGWDRRITYVLDASFINVRGFATTNAGTLTVQDAATNNRTTQAVTVLISHGANGHGAWPKNGGATRVDASSADAGEIENANDVTNNPSFIDPAFTDKVFTQAPLTSTFDDMVRYRLKWQLVRDAGGVLDSDVCHDAKRTLMPLNDTPGAGLPNEGPVGCQDEDAGGYNAECWAREIRLAEAVAEKCL